MFEDNYSSYVGGLRRLDYVFGILCLTLVVLIFIFLVFRNTNQQNLRVEIKTESDTLIYPINKDRILELTGPLGKTVVKIFENKISVDESPGRRQICVNSKPIEKNGEWLACLPNKIFIRIYGGSHTSELDAVVF